METQHNRSGSMIEPYVSDRKCNGCGEWKALFHFSVAGYSAGKAQYRGVCKVCRRIYSRKPNKRGDMGDRSPTAWLMPRDERNADDKALDGVLRAWRGPVSREPMRWAA